jgi:hypothetical protein
MRRPIGGHQCAASLLMLRRWLWGLVVVSILGTTTACSIRDPWEDARIEGEVKAGLVEKKNANLTRLGVVSREAVVYLTGTVASAEEKALAEAVAKGVAGVRRVVSTLEIRPAGTTSSQRSPAPSRRAAAAS